MYKIIDIFGNPCWIETDAIVYIAKDSEITWTIHLIGDSYVSVNEDTALAVAALLS
jgi:hypothetical protein